MSVIAGFDFFPLHFDKDGKPINPAEFASLKARAATATDFILMAHGFRNDENDANRLYTNFLTSFRAHFSRPEFRPLTGPDFVTAGVFWPSLVLPEEFSAPGGSTQSADEDAAQLATLRAKLDVLKALSPENASELDRAAGLLSTLKDDGDAQNEFAGLVLSVAEPGPSDPTEGFELIRNQDGVTMFQALSAPLIIRRREAVEADADSSGGAESFATSLFSVLGGVDKFINLTMWYVMKNRCGVVGLTGVAAAVRDIKVANPNIKIHLVGHSLGGRLIAGCTKALSVSPIMQPDSVTLLEAAFSHYGFSANNGDGVPGFFREVIDNKVVKGPFVATFSAEDTVVGTTYSLASRLARDNAKALGDASDPYGGIGRNGAQKTTESSISKLKAAGDGIYSFAPGIVNCLDGSGGLIKDHGDVTNPNVTYAFASAVSATQPKAVGGAGVA